MNRDSKESIDKLITQMENIECDITEGNLTRVWRSIRLNASINMVILHELIEIKELLIKMVDENES